MTVLPHAMATGDSFLTTAKAWEWALRQAEFDVPATGSAPFYSTVGSRVSLPSEPPPSRRARALSASSRVSHGSSSTNQVR